MHYLDIAIIRFPPGQVFNLSPDLRPIGRINFHWSNINLDGHIVTLSGWGRIQIRVCPRGYLMVAENPIEQQHKFTHPDVLYVRRHEGRGSGKGDSGGIELLYKSELFFIKLLVRLNISRTLLTYILISGPATITEADSSHTLVGIIGGDATTFNTASASTLGNIKQYSVLTSTFRHRIWFEQFFG